MTTVNVPYHEASITLQALENFLQHTVDWMLFQFFQKKTFLTTTSSYIIFIYIIFKDPGDLSGLFLLHETVSILHFEMNPFAIS